MGEFEVADTPRKVADIGMKQLRALSNQPFSKRLDLIAEGLPILLRSAETLYAARNTIGSGGRAGEILLGHATEEAAKILILLDYVRCPPSLSKRAQGQLRAFYDHGARLIYAAACRWRPDTVATLRDYVDRTRASHYIEGDFGQYILPNWDLYSREARLYADLTRTDSGIFVWNDPDEWPDRPDIFCLPPPALAVSQALDRMGAFSREGLQVIHDIWSVEAFVTDQHALASDGLIEATITRLAAKNLPRAEATDADVRMVCGSWQMPMYDIDVLIQAAELDALRAEQEAQARHLY